MLLNGFTIEDEFVYSENHFTKHLGNIPRLFDSAYFQYSNEASYRPVCTLTYFLDTAIWGGWPGGPHLTNLMMFVLTEMVLFAFFRVVTKDQVASFLGAALFAIHPVHTEVINNISFREDLLVGLLVPVAWLCYKRLETGNKWLWLFLSWLAYFLALFSQENAVTFLVLAGLLEWTESEGQWQPLLTRRKLVFVAGLLVLSLFFALVRFHWMRFDGEAHTPQLGGSIWATLISDVKIQAHYVKLFFFPYPLIANYPASMYSARIDLRFLVSLGCMVLLVAFVAYFRRARFFLLGVLWWFVSLAPVANIQPIFIPMAERYLFLPSIGPCLWAGWAIARSVRSRARNLVIGLCIAVAITLAAITFLRNPDWRDNMTLWQATARVVSDDPRVLANLAAAQFNQGNYHEAIATAKLSLELKETTSSDIDPAPIYLCMGSAYYMLHETDLALDYLTKAEVGLPSRFDIDAAVYRNLGLIYDDRNDLKTALRYYKRASAIDPYRIDLWRKSAFCELRLGNRSHAEKSWNTARTLDPSLIPFKAIEMLYKKTRQQPPESDQNLN